MHGIVLAAILLLASPIWPQGKESLSESEKAWTEEVRLWMIVNANSPSLEDYFNEERQQLQTDQQALTGDRQALQQERQAFEREKSDFEQEKSVLESLRQQVVSERTMLAEDSKRLDLREKRVQRIESLLRWTPAAVLVIYAAGYVTAMSMQ